MKKNQKEASFKLIITDNREKCRIIWEKVFANNLGVQVLSGSFSNFEEIEEVDAVLMAQRHALELFGGKPATGKVLIFNNRKTKSVSSKKVVTSAPVRITLEAFFNTTTWNTNLQNEATNFEKIFKAISKFNIKNPSNTIRVIGLDIPSWVFLEDLDFIERYATVLKDTFNLYKPELDRSLLS